MLIIFAGLPGVGKSTIAQYLAERIKAIYLRIDSIEQAIRSSEIISQQADIGPAGYITACRLAADNLRLGHTVIVDSVNPIEITRDAYRSIAEQLGINYLEIEIVCSDKTIHRRRIETRTSSVEGLLLPTWDQVQAREYAAWNRPILQLDTAKLSVISSVQAIMSAISVVTSKSI